MTKFIARALKGLAVAGAFAAVLAVAPKANAAEVIVAGPRAVAIEHGPVFAPGYGPVYGGPIYHRPIAAGWGWGRGHEGWGRGGFRGGEHRGGFRGGSVRGGGIRGGGIRGGENHGGGFHGGPAGGHGRR